MTPRTTLAAFLAPVLLLGGCAVETAEHAALSGNAFTAQSAPALVSDPWPEDRGPPASADGAAASPETATEEGAGASRMPAYGAPAGTRSTFRSVTLGGSDLEIGGRALEAAKAGPASPAVAPSTLYPSGYPSSRH